MRAVTVSILTGALTLASTIPTFAQARPQTPPAGQKPPATTPPATGTGQAPAAPAPAAPKPQPPVPFPQDAKYAFVDVQAVASGSAAGKAATARLQALTESKQKELADKNKQLQALTTKRDTSLGVTTEGARAQMDKDIEKLQREIQFAQTNAQAEVQDLNNELMNDFQQKLAPIIEAIAKEKGLYMVFTPESGFAYINPGLNITDEVIKRLDAKK